jgi:hypothetical protein
MSIDSRAMGQRTTLSHVQSVLDGLSAQNWWESSMSYTMSMTKKSYNFTIESNLESTILSRLIFNE